MLGDGIKMYKAGVEPRDFTGVKPSKYPEWMVKPFYIDNKEWKTIDKVVSVYLSACATTINYHKIQFKFQKYTNNRRKQNQLVIILNETNVVLLDIWGPKIACTNCLYSNSTYNNKRLVNSLYICIYIVYEQTVHTCYISLVKLCKYN